MQYLTESEVHIDETTGTCERAARLFWMNHRNSQIAFFTDLSFRFCGQLAPLVVLMMYLYLVALADFCFDICIFIPVLIVCVAIDSFTEVDEDDAI